MKDVTESTFIVYGLVFIDMDIFYDLLHPLSCSFYKFYKFLVGAVSLVIGAEVYYPILTFIIIMIIIILIIKCNRFYFKDLRL